MSAAAKTPADLLMFAVIDCAHHIEDSAITLKRSLDKPGNARHQLTARLEAALPRAAVGLIPPAVPRSADTRPGLAALALARKATKEMRESAAHDGHMHDGGASHLEALCAAFECGLRGTMPDFLRSYAEQALREADPEYAQYQRLHAKFGGKA